MTGYKGPSIEGWAVFLAALAFVAYAFIGLL